MKGRTYARVGCLTISAWLLVGCAGGQTRSEEVDFSNRPHLVVSGANRADLKGLAMGSARAKGWKIVRSTDDRLVVQRPIDPTSPALAATGASNSVTPPMVEVTTAFQEQSGGVDVALAAVLITQPKGAESPKRSDFTDTYRDALNQSLESLQASWSKNQHRIAQAMPTRVTKADETSAAASNPLVKVWSETLADQSASQRGKPAGTSPSPTPVSATPAPEPRAQATPVAYTPAPAAVPPSSPAPVTPVVAQPTPTQPRNPSGAAPIVDGTAALAGASAVPLDRVAPLPTPTGEVAPRDNMVALSQTGGAGEWAYYAEQYARLRGCNIADSGTQLIETVPDGEIHKVACVGATSYLLKCSNGVCRGLQ